MSLASASVTTSAGSPSTTERACAPDPPWLWRMVTSCPVFAFHEAAYRKFAREWIEENEIDANLTFIERQPSPKSQPTPKAKPAEELVTEFVNPANGTSNEVCRVYIRRTKQAVRVDIEAWAGGKRLDKELRLRAEELPLLITALQYAQSEL